MTSPQSLLYAAPSAITIERIRTLVRLVGPEAPTVEYKEKMCDTIAKGVAALANTYGGLLLVGVTDDTRIVKGVKEKTIESVAEHCAATIEPPYVPEIIPVPLGQGSDLYVLVLRVVPGQYRRPLLVGGAAPVRHQNTTHPADWQRLRDLFNEPSPGQPEDAWNIRAPELPEHHNGYGDSAPDPTVDFVIRTGLGFSMAPQARWRPLQESMVTALIDALNQSELHRVLMHHSLGNARSGGMDPFHREGLNRSRTVQLQWTGEPDGWPDRLPGPIDAVVRLAVPGGYGHHATLLSLELDVTVRITFGALVPLLLSDHLSRLRERNGESPSPEIESMQNEPEVRRRALVTELGRYSTQRPRVAVQDLGDLIDALLATLTSGSVVESLAQLGQLDPMAVPQPRVMHLRTPRPVPEVLDTTGLRPIRGAGDSHAAHLLADPALDLADPSERREQVHAWLTQIALDAGLLGMEQIVEHLSVQQG